MSSMLELFELIGELARRRYQAGERGFAALGLNHTEARLLTLLTQQGGEASQEALSSRLTVDRSNAVRALQRLEQHGLVTRRVAEDDRRARWVGLTAEGRQTVAGIERLRQQMALSFFGDLEEDEAATVVALLRKAL